MLRARSLILASASLFVGAVSATAGAQAEAARAPSVEASPGVPALAEAGSHSGRAWWRPVADRGWLGVRLGDQRQAQAALAAPEMPDAWHQVLNLPWVAEGWDGEGALVVEAFAETPAEKAGLLPGDVIVAFNGIRTGSPGILAFVVQRAMTGHDGNLEVLRDGETRRVLVEIGMHPEDLRRLEEEKKAASEDAARKDVATE